MNILQHLPESKHGLVLVTLNPPFPVDPAKTIGRWTYEHPMMTTASVASQTLVPEIQTSRGISFAGAWTKYGFHEDGFTSGMRLVTAPPFNVTPPFQLQPADRNTHITGASVFTARALIGGLDQVRRLVQPLWVCVAWLVVLIFICAEKSSRFFGFDIGTEIGRLKIAWSPKYTHWREKKTN